MTLQFVGVFFFLTGDKSVTRTEVEGGKKLPYHRCEVMTMSLVLGAEKQLRGLPGLGRGSPLLKGKRLQGRFATDLYTFLRFNAVAPVVTGE